jgi:diketogulonate reductase-like aldo/keto reductase
MNNITLSNGQAIPNVGFGTWNLEKNTVARSVEAAIKTGYRHIDCAMVYQNEKEVGEGLKNALDSGIVKREELFITSKLWNTDHDPKDVEAACRKTLSDLGLEYLDLYLVHWGVSFEHGEELEPLDENGLAKLSFVPEQQTWQAMESLPKKGLVRSIGVANFNATMLIDMLGYAKVKPLMNQIELHPYHAQDELIAFCAAQKITVTAYSPLGSTGAVVAEDAVLKQIGAKYNKTAAQVALRWALQRNTIAIPKTSHDERIAENFNIFDFELTPEDMQAISKINRRRPLVDPFDWWGFPYF